MTASASTICRRRGCARYAAGRIGVIFQDPLTSLNPLMRIGDQLVETILAHLAGRRRRGAEARARAGSREVGIPAPEKRIDGYPHEFSGGMRQRVVIALALCAEPELVIADEPTTALDVSVQAQIIALLKKLTRASTAPRCMLITHDMGVIAETADRVAVMYAGRIVEIGAVARSHSPPLHPYTRRADGRDPDARGPRRAARADPRRDAAAVGDPAGLRVHPRCPPRSSAAGRAARRCSRSGDGASPAGSMSEPGQAAAAIRQ